jgi:glycine/sarcosine N-methyltransferase
MPMTDRDDVFGSADWYDRGINWDARLAREIPVLRAVFGPPGEGGLLDAGCGSGRHVRALAALGYGLTGLDVSPAMLAQARQVLADGEFPDGVTRAPRWVEAAFADAPRACATAPGGGFDGAYCLGNALAAVGDPAAVGPSLAGLAECLRPGGRFFLQILNFAKLHAERPRVRGPRVRHHAGVEYVSTRVYAFEGACVEVTNVTMWHDGTDWRQHAHAGRLAVITEADIERHCTAAGMHVDRLLGGYDGSAFDAAASNDLIVVATRG